MNVQLNKIKKNHRYFPQKAGTITLRFLFCHLQTTRLIPLSAWNTTHNAIIRPTRFGKFSGLSCFWA